MKRKREIDTDRTPVKKKAKPSESANFKRYFQSLPQIDNTVRFFKKPDGYYLYQDDADYIATIQFDRNSQVIKGNDALRYILLRAGPQFVDVCKKVIHMNKSLEIHQLDDGGDWKVEKEASPGNVEQIEDIMFSNGRMEGGNVMMAVWIGNGEKNLTEFGVAFIDTIMRDIGICQMSDDMQLSNLESLFFQTGTKEIICCPFSEKDPVMKKLFLIVEKANILKSEVKKKEFLSNSIDQDIKRVIGDDRYRHCINLLDMNLAMKALTCLIKKLGILNNEADHGTYTLSSYDLNEFMSLDAAAIGALNILPNPSEPNQKLNIYGLFNKCQTGMGSRLLLKWLKQPLQNIEKINERLDIVESLHNDSILRSDLQESCMKKVPDLERLSKKILRGRGQLQDVVNIYQFCVDQLPQFVHYLGHTSNSIVQEKFLKNFEELKSDLDSYIDLVEAAVDIETALKHHEYLIHSTFDEPLQALEKKRKKVKRRIEKHEVDVKTLLGDPSSFQIHKDKSTGFHFKLSAKDGKLLDRKNFKNKFKIIHQAKNVKFTDITLTEYNDEYKELNELYVKHSKETILWLLEVVATYIPLFEEATKSISALDVYCSFAQIASSAPTPYCRPILTDSETGNIILEELRHPLLEYHTDIFIPNTINMKRGESSFHLITGPNMGGKSTYIRSVGIAVLLAQVGSMVPCDRAEISIRDSILARVGAGDSQLRGVSTFMSEMLETTTIINRANKNSLVIIDELGRGTSTYDGFGLAWAISEYLCTSVESFTLFATHFHELTQLETKIPIVENFHVTADVDEENGDLTFLYEVHKGPSDQSFGIHVARLAHFPEAVIQLAQEKSNELENFEAIDMFNVDEQKLESEKILNELLTEFKKTDLTKLSPTQLSDYKSTLSSRLKSINNEYIREIIKQHDI